MITLLKAKQVGNDMVQIHVNRTAEVETFEFDGNVQINCYDADGIRYEMEENGQLVQFIWII